MAKQLRSAAPAPRKARGTMQICLDIPKAPTPQWCWRDDWVQRGESIYSLIGLFEALNVVGGRQIRAEFVDAVQPGTSRFLIQPTLDLLRPDRFRAAWFATVIRQQIDVVNQSFVSEAFPVSGWVGHRQLFWCPQCVKSGYHAPLFQLPMIYECPAHHCPLESRCPRCRSSFPYQLTTNSATPLFCCPGCKLDLAPGMRKGRRRPLGAEEIRMLGHRAELMKFCDSLPTMVSEALDTPVAPRGGDVIVSPPALRVAEPDFKTFVTQVLASLRSANQADWDRCEPSFSYVDNGQAVRRINGKLIAARSGWSDHLVPASDWGLHRAAALYRCVRRHLWQTVVRPHRRCVTAVCRRLWWPIIGCETPSFCVVAAAFIRWRVQWESAVRCTDLMAAAISPPLGLVTWLASAPVGPAAGTKIVESWLVDHVLAGDLINTFESMLAEEIARPYGEPIRWSRARASFADHACWVCTGRGTKHHPARLFVRCCGDHERRRPERVDPGHYARHLAAVASIEH